MLLELAVGDAYGAGFEYANEDIVQTRNNLSGYIAHPKHNLKPGSYTDDTQMSLAIAELLIEGKEWSPLNIASKFVEVFKRDPRQGYASGFYAFLQEVRDGKEFLQRIVPYSDKSGAAMRAGPLGFLPSRAEVIDYALTQANLTHNTPAGGCAALAAALMSHYFIYECGKKKDLGRFLEQHVSGDWNTPWQGMVGARGYMSVRAAITAIMGDDSLSSILKRCVSFGGDVDTVACIAMAAASSSTEVTQDLPLSLINSLENGRFGRAYLAKIDHNLKEVFGV